MKIKMSFILLAILLVSEVNSQITTNCVTDGIIKGYSERTYSTVRVTDQQLGIFLDCGLTTESMFVAAHGLGLGARIYGSPVGNINAKRDVYQIPAGYKAVIVLRIGNVDKTVDVVSAASARKKSEEIVNFKK